MTDDPDETAPAREKPKKPKKPKKEKPHQEAAGEAEAGAHGPPATPPEQRKLVLQTVENLHAPEFFATDAQSISLINGMISIAFASSRYDYSETPSALKNVVVSRVVMSPAGAQNLAVRLFNFLEAKGFAAVPKDPKQRQ